MITSPSPDPRSSFLLEVGDLVEAWPHNTTPAEAQRHAFGASPAPWRGRVRGVTDAFVVMDPSGDAVFRVVAVPWRWISWMRVRRDRGGAG